MFAVLYAYASQELDRLNKHFWLRKTCDHDPAMGDLQLLARCVPAESPSPGACMNPCGPVEGSTLTGLEVIVLHKLSKLQRQLISGNSTLLRLKNVSLEYLTFEDFIRIVNRRFDLIAKEGIMCFVTCVNQH
jgi:hypothetical protein